MKAIVSREAARGVALVLLALSCVVGPVAASDRVTVTGTVDGDSGIPVTIRDSTGYSTTVRSKGRHTYAAGGLAPGAIVIEAETSTRFGSMTCEVPANRTLRFALRLHLRNVFTPEETLPMSTCTLDPDTDDANAVRPEAITGIGQP